METRELGLSNNDAGYAKVSGLLVRNHGPPGASNRRGTYPMRRVSDRHA